MIEEMITTTLDLTNYKPKQKLYDDYNKLLDNALEVYKKNNTLEEITEDITDENGNVLLPIADQIHNRDYVIKQQLKEEITIGITEDNLLEYFDEKPKSEVDILKEQIAQLMLLLQQKNNEG